MNSTPTLIINQAFQIKQLGKSKQDHAAQGTYTENGYTTRWSAVWDGHGDDHVINYIRQAPMDEIMKSKTPADTLHNLILDDKSVCYDKKIKSGSTMVWAKETEFADHRKIEIGNVGDSQAVLFVENELVFVSKRHNVSNPGELLRLFRQNRLNKTFPITQRGTAFETLSQNTLVSINSYYLRFNSKLGDIIELAASQSIGHQDITGVFPEITTFKLNLTDPFRIALLSDGVIDVMPFEGPAMASTILAYNRANTPTDILEEAERRWKQEWTVQHSIYRQNTNQDRFPENGYDDCVCAFLEGNPLWANIPDSDEMVEMSEETFDNEDLLIFDTPLIQPTDDSSSEDLSNAHLYKIVMDMMTNNSIETNPMKTLMELLEMSGKNPDESRTL